MSVKIMAEVWELDIPQMEGFAAPGIHFPHQVSRGNTIQRPSFRVGDDTGVEGLRSTQQRYSRPIPGSAMPSQTSSNRAYGPNSGRPATPRSTSGVVVSKCSVSGDLPGSVAIRNGPGSGVVECRFTSQVHARFAHYSSRIWPSQASSRLRRMCQRC